MIDQLSREESLLIKLSVHNTAEYPGLLAFRLSNFLQRTFKGVLILVVKCSPGQRDADAAHYFSYGCVVLFDANVSLYFVIGCGGFESQTQPRYTSSSKHKDCNLVRPHRLSHWSLTTGCVWLLLFSAYFQPMNPPVTQPGALKIQAVFPLTEKLLIYAKLHL